MGKSNRSLRGLKPFTPRSTARLLRVCDVVRDALGLGMFNLWTEFPKKDGPEGDLACATTFYSGWKCRLRFYPHFFRRPLDVQLYAIVHEHIHLLMHPYDQAIARHQLTLKSEVNETFEEAITVAREITVDHATGPIYKLLEQRILAAL